MANLPNLGETEDEKEKIQALGQFLIWLAGDVNNTLSHFTAGDYDQVVSHMAGWLVNLQCCGGDVSVLIADVEFDHMTDECTRHAAEEIRQGNDDFAQFWEMSQSVIETWKTCKAAQEERSGND